MLLRIAVLLSALAAVGCAATGRSWSEDVSARIRAAEKARLTIYRTGATMQYSARAVRIAVDRTTVGGVDYKGFNVFDVDAGRHTLTADMWDSPGKCDVPIDVAAGGDYYFEVVPRSDNLVAGLALGVLGMAAESSGLQCGGAFALAPVARDTAQPDLAPLKLSE